MASLRRLLGFLIALLLVVFSLPALADGGDKFSAVMSPTSPPAQAGPITFTATIKNLARFDYLKSYTVTVPAGLTISGTPTASSGSVSVSGQVVSVSGTLVAYTKTTKLTIKATPASTLGCAPSALLWGATAKGGLFVSNEVFTLDSSSVLQTTVTPLCYTLTYGAGSGGSIIGATPQTVSPGGSGSPVTAQANALYTFTGWSDGSTANPRTDTNVTGNINVTASFVANTLTITTQPTSAAVNVPFTVIVATSPGAPTVSMASTCGATNAAPPTISGNSTTFSLSIATAGDCTLTFSATNYPSAQSTLKVLAGQVATCGSSDPSVLPPPEAQFSASAVCGAGSVNVTGFAAGFRGPNKPSTSACAPLNFSLTNNICNTVTQQDANGKAIPPNAISLVWDQATQKVAFSYTATWKAEYVNPATGLPFAQKTKYCIGTSPSAPCGDVNDPNDPNRVPLKACISPEIAATSIPSGEPACIVEEDWVTVPQSECAGLPLPTGATGTPACTRATTILIDAVDPPIIRG